MRPSRTALLNRYREITAALTRHGLGYLVMELGLGRYLPFNRGLLRHRPREAPYTRADHLRLALEDLGPTFVKLGQVLSTRPDLVPPDWSVEFAKLQERVPPVPWNQVWLKLARELGRPPEEIFAQIEPQPLAAASIGQVHRGVLYSGEVVVVKVQRPGVYRQVQLDLEVLRSLARMAQRRLAAYDPLGLVEEFARTILDELDYTKERRNLERYAQNLADTEGVRIPRVYPQASGREVLTLEYIEGVRVDDLAGVQGYGLDPAQLAGRMARLLFRSAFGWGFFHADPHPGNFRVTPQGELVLLDFGMVGHLSRPERGRLLELVLAVVDSDAVRAADRLAELGVPIAPGQATAFRHDLERLLYQYIELPIGQMPMGDILGRFLEIVRAYQLHLPAHLSILAKTIMMAEGVGVQLDPNFHLAPLVKPLFQRIFLERLQPKQVQGRLREGALDLLALLEEGPAGLRRLLDRVERGELELRIRSDQEFLQEMRGIANGLRLSALTIALILALAGLMMAYHPPGWERWAGWVFGVGLAGVLGLGGYLLLVSWRKERP
ncbi:ABC1 kinase family protein [Meiothermus granaticius]|uniref:ABC1 atypical kinase-like domain-containing protein n=1 Tax=Meiothermus granaticius NBRC 107808 TaxID=1227551 RepID=A0A399FCS1_9DEIN|nr:AarF/ABC1/UbiB kinase family protein [Meiothermus granaticius]MCL6526375.1 AarF/ABC1/UbiB kinase family protein [Thermaceae bacterium]RIH93525.1 putative protein kinase UbiB [Meiothermus granaticius NBRC 107808]GEM86021.1 ubiquinone biosynthesis protein UbiB [Meiothermus granaticius NBRC 107808]